MHMCILTRSEPAHRGGKATFHQDILGSELSKRGHEVTIITTGREDGIEAEKRDGMSIFYLKGTSPDVYSEQFWKKSAKKFDELHKEKRFDIVCSESAGAFGWATYSKYKGAIPLIHIKHNTFSTIRKITPLDIVLNRILPDIIKFKLASLRDLTIPPLNLSIKRILGRYLVLFDKRYVFFKNVTEKLLIRADAIMCVCKTLASLVMRDCPQSKEKIHIVYNAIDMARFTPNEEDAQNFKRELGIASERIILYIGRLSPEKGIDYLIKSLPYIRNKYFKLVILGHGNQEYVRKLDTLIRELNIEDRIILIRGVSYSEVPIYYGMADIVVLPSLGEGEAFPFVIIEAFASRKPVIASRVGGVAEIVENNVNGYLIPRKNSKILAEKIGALLDDESLRDSFAKSGYNLVSEKFTIHKMIQETEKVFDCARLNFLQKRTRSKSAHDWAYRERIKIMQKYNDNQFLPFDRILWRGGYDSTGDPANPASGGTEGNGVTFFQIYKACIKPFIKRNTRVLEIGCGRGAWTKALLPAKEVWCLEALSLERNKILEYLGYPKNLKYIQVTDFQCNQLPDDYFDFLFSYGCFCHLSWEGIVSYMTNLFPKMKKGAIGIVMISDWTKHPNFVRGIDKITGLNEENYRWYPGCWTPNNSKEMSDLLSKIGWTVIDADYLKCKRDTLIYFKK